jgi:hypothetical protein
MSRLFEPKTRRSSGLIHGVAVITTDIVQNLSAVVGATCTAALNTLKTGLDDLAAALAGLAGSDVANDSGVAGATISDALNTLLGAKANANLSFVTEAGTAFSLGAAHVNKVVLCTAATEVTVTADELSEGNVVALVQMGAGQVVVVDGTCATLVAASYVKATLEQNSQIFLQYLTDSSALMTGQLEAAP